MGQENRRQETESSSFLTSVSCLPSLLDCPALSWSLKQGLAKLNLNSVRLE